MWHHENAGMEDTRLENATPNSQDWNLQDWEMPDWDMQGEKCMEHLASFEAH